MITSAREAIGSVPFFWLQLSGYTVFAFAGVFISLAATRAMLDLTSALAEFSAGRRKASSEMTIPPVVSPKPAMPDRVIAFSVPKKTRNRLVVR